MLAVETWPGKNIWLRRWAKRINCKVSSMKYQDYQALDQAWAALSLALGRFNSDSSAQCGESVRRSCDTVKASILTLASHAAEEGRKDDARGLLAVMQTINTHSAEVFEQQASLAASYSLPPKLNSFGTFLSSMNLSDRIKAFQAAIPGLQERCGNHFLGVA
jgi:hypothetical protein